MYQSSDCDEKCQIHPLQIMCQLKQAGIGASSGYVERSVAMLQSYKVNKIRQNQQLLICEKIYEKSVNIIQNRSSEKQHSQGWLSQHLPPHVLLRVEA